MICVGDWYILTVAIRLNLQGNGMGQKGTIESRLRSQQRKLVSKFFPTIPDEYKEIFKNVKLETNVGRMTGLAVYIIAVQVILNVINVLRPSDTKPGNIKIYIVLSMITLFVGILYLTLLRLVKKRKIKSVGAKYFLTESLLYFYILMQMTFCTLNVYGSGELNSFFIAIMIVGVFPVLHPVQSVTTALVTFTYMIVIVFASRDVSPAWNNILKSDIGASLIAVIGFTICVSIFFYDMYVSNFVQSVELVHANDDLEKMVSVRTIELEEQTEAARVASRAKSDFLARMSHEIRTPLNAIIGMTEIAKKTDIEEKKAVSLNEISTASSHLLGILNDILDMSKIESGKFVIIEEPFDLNQALNEIIGLFSMRCADDGIDFQYNVERFDDYSVVGDRLRLKQVIINLLGNAQKFSQVEGRIDFSLKVIDEYRDKVVLMFSVSDTGIGISEEKIASLFHPFEQADTTISSKYGGTGLGLAISKNLVDQMGGKIQVESELGKGSTFSFSVCLKKAELQKPDSDLSEVPDLTGKRILIVEDITINRVILTEFLEETNAAFEEAATGEEALRMYSESPNGYYDLIFMDIQMPGIDGYETTKRIRATDRKDSKNISIIAMTANAYKEDIEHALEAGMNGHVSKPLDLEVLMRALIAELQ